MEKTAELGETSKSLGDTSRSALGDTKNFASTKELQTTVKEGMTLIDRFYDGGNRARPAALDILVVVLDGVVKRMRQQYATRIRGINEGEAEMAQIDQQVAAITKRRAPLVKELEELQTRAAELREKVDLGTKTIDDSVDAAREALAKAQLLQRKTEARMIAGQKLSDKGYDGKGKALPGREVNLRKKPNGPAARKPGDMLKDLDLR